MANDPYDERSQCFAPRRSRHSGGRWADDKPGWNWFYCLAVIGGLVIACAPPLIFWLVSQ